MSGGGPGWLPGDRLPDVRVQGQDGDPVTLHAGYAGMVLWLAIEAEDALGEVARLPPAGTGMHALRLRRTGAPARAGELPEGWRDVAVDPGWLRELRGDRRGDVAWIADANLRLVRSGDFSLFDSAADPRTAGRDLPAPVLVVPDVFEADLCDELIRHFELDCHGGEPSGVVVLEKGQARFALAPEIKQRRESFVRDQALEARMHERLLRRALPEIDRAFHFRVSRRDPFKLLAYEAGAGYFRAHRDNDTPDVAHRRFALSVNLDAGNYDGGEFLFPEFGAGRYSPPTGAALVFSCSLLHAVSPVERGCRHAMTTFLG